MMFWNAKNLLYRHLKFRLIRLLIIDPKEAEKLIKNLTKKMKRAVKELNFEEAAHIRDEIRNIKKNMLLMDKV